MAKISHTTSNQKKLGMPIIISDKIDFKLLEDPKVIV